MLWKSTCKDVKWQKEMDRRPGPYVKRFRGGGCICNDPKGLAWMGSRLYSLTE